MVKINDEDLIGYNIQYSRDKVFAILFNPLLWAHNAKKCAKPEEIWYEVEEFVKHLKDVRYPEYQVPKLVEHMKACGMDDNNLFLACFCVCYKLVAPAKSGNEWAFRIFQMIYPDIQKHNWFEHFQLMANYYEKKLVKDGYKPINLSKYDREHLIFDEKVLAEILGKEEKDVEDIDVPKEKIMDLPKIVHEWIRNDVYLTNLFVVIIRSRVVPLLGHAKDKAKWAHVMKVMIELPVIADIPMDTPKPFGDLIASIVEKKSSGTVVKGVTGHKSKIANGRWKLWDDDNINKTICKEIYDAFAPLMSKSPNRKEES